MDQQIREVLQGKQENHILPFLWMKGEKEEKIRHEMEKIASCGIGAVCLESRPHPDFLGPLWWHDLDIVLDEAKKREMKVWILDDLHFPTGYANGLIAKKYPERAKQYLAVRCFDVTGPLYHTSLWIDGAMRPTRTWADVRRSGPVQKPLVDEEKLVSVVAMRMSDGDTVRTGEPPAGRAKNAHNESLLSEGCFGFDLTGRVKEGRVRFDFPAGVWRVFVVYTTYGGGGDVSYINLIDKQSAATLIEAVYEPHYERYREEFGRTIAGFFSDEPGFGNTYGYDMDEAIGRKKMNLPWSREVPELLKERLGDDWKKMLPLLWFPSTCGVHAARMRFAYMDAVTKLAAAHFSGQLGTWCKERGVEYIGHIIEDNNIHSRLGCGEGHYFRAMSGQAMAGIDEIGGQILPGNPHTTRHEYIDFDGDFFHFMTAKMGASAALMQPDKKGRLLCEMFGTYGYGLGVRDMKWIADYMIAQGVNYLVPHAFSMGEYPDPDCPPHFYAGGHNPQFPYFARLMRYCNRLCHIFSGGRWVPEVGILYHAEMDWMDACMTDQVPARILHDGHIDYAIVPSDALADAVGEGDGHYQACVRNGYLLVGGVRLKILIVPRGRYIDPVLVRFMEAYPEVRVLFIDQVPESIGEAVPEGAQVVRLDELVPVIHKKGVVGARADVKGDAVFYHYEKESGDLWMVFNESVTEAIHGNLLVKPGAEGRRVYRYDPMKNVVYPVEQLPAVGFDEPRMLCTLELQPYESAVFFTASEEEVSPEAEDPNEWCVKREEDLTEGWHVEAAEAADDPAFEELGTMIERFRSRGEEVFPDAERAAELMADELFPVSDLLPTFSGVLRYTREIEIRYPGRRYAIDAAHLYEAGRVIVNGKETDCRMCPPYRFLLDHLKEGKNTVIIETAGTMLRDALKMKAQAPGHETYVYEPAGMFGKIRLLEIG